MTMTRDNKMTLAVVLKIVVSINLVFDLNDFPTVH